MKNVFNNTCIIHISRAILCKGKVNTSCVTANITGETIEMQLPGNFTPFSYPCKYIRSRSVQ